jgi:hypothetical protein
VFSTWKSRLLSPAGDDCEERSEEKQYDAAPTHAGQRGFVQTVEDVATGDALRRLIEEQRAAAEALLHELRTVEERLKIQVLAAEAAREFAAANEKADAAAIVEQQAKELAQDISERLRAMVAQREVAAALLPAAWRDAQAAKAEVAELEQLLHEGQQSAAETSLTLDRCHTRAEECAELERAAASEEGEALQRVAACEVAYLTAASAALAAKERAEALKRESLSAMETLTEINEVHRLAMRIAEAASALMPRSRSAVVSHAHEGLLGERARCAYPSHPKRQSAFVDGWKSCAEQMMTDDSVRILLVRYTKHIGAPAHSLPNERAIASMRNAIRETQALDDR